MVQVFVHFLGDKQNTKLANENGFLRIDSDGETASNLSVAAIKSRMVERFGIEALKQMVVFRGHELPDSLSMGEASRFVRKEQGLLDEDMSESPGDTFEPEDILLNIFLKAPPPTSEAPPEFVKEMMPRDVFITQINRMIPPTALKQLIEMGFSPARSFKAMVLNRLNVSNSITWLVSHMDDPTLDDPLTYDEVYRFAQQFGMLSSPEIQASIGRNECTFNVTKNRFFSQQYVHCFTCNLTGARGCCIACARVCHQGHSVSESLFSPSFFCDCGAGDGPSPCRALVRGPGAAPTSAPSVSPNPTLATPSATPAPTPVQPQRGYIVPLGASPPPSAHTHTHSHSHHSHSHSHGPHGHRPSPPPQLFPTRPPTTSSSPNAGGGGEIDHFAVSPPPGPSASAQRTSEASGPAPLLSNPYAYLGNPSSFTSSSAAGPSGSGPIGAPNPNAGSLHQAPLQQAELQNLLGRVFALQRPQGAPRSGEAGGGGVPAFAAQRIAPLSFSNSSAVPSNPALQSSPQPLIQPLAPLSFNDPSPGSSGPSAAQQSIQQQQQQQLFLLSQQQKLQQQRQQLQQIQQQHQQERAQQQQQQQYLQFQQIAQQQQQQQQSSGPQPQPPAFPQPQPASQPSQPSPRLEDSPSPLSPRSPFGQSSEPSTGSNLSSSQMAALFHAPAPSPLSFGAPQFQSAVPSSMGPLSAQFSQSPPPSAAVATAMAALPGPLPMPLQFQTVLPSSSSAWGSGSRPLSSASQAHTQGQMQFGPNPNQPTS